MKDTRSDDTSCKWLQRIVFMAFLSYFLSRVGMSCLKLMENDLGTIQKKAVAHKVRDGADGQIMVLEVIFDLFQYCKRWKIMIFRSHF